MGNPGNSSDSGKDLHAAARSGDLHAVQTICSSNPLAINSRDKHSRTPLHLAAWAGQTEVVSYLCKDKADVGGAAMDDMGALHFAAQKGHIEVVRVLLASGVSVQASNRKGLTPLHYAVQGSHLELIKYLIRKGANLSAKTKAGKTPVDVANNEEVRSYLVECEELSKRGEDLKGKDKESVVNRSLEVKRRGSPEESDLKKSSEKFADSDKHGEKEGKTEPVKWKDECAATKESLPKSKKARVALNHLLAEDDTQEV
ncbi:putative ankyrin repeat protein RF_0381 [Telopea speciosissima]|uniref:putative ankyrin repeat protein RF_0381 n=1 Tax=Telopea speciosissima TaxID=54955 RepID=UPI001CC6B2D3|nr:putative ankyrin repeat protein RF_0381 [Telopea speciosissima]